MAKYSLLYSKLQFCNVPRNTDVLLSKTYDKVYYKSGRKHVVLKTLDIFPTTVTKPSFPFADVKLLEDGDQGGEGFYKLVIELDLDKVGFATESTAISVGPQHRKKGASADTTPNKDAFFNILKQCYWQETCSYAHQLLQNMCTINSFDILVARKLSLEKLDDDNSKRLLYCEYINTQRGRPSFYMLPPNTYNVGDHYFDVTNCTITSVPHTKDNKEHRNKKEQKSPPKKQKQLITKTKISFNGGIIIDSYDYYWISSFVKFVSHYNKEVNQGGGTNLVFCCEEKIPMWERQIMNHSQKNNYKVTMKIVNKTTNSTFSNMQRTDYIIVDISHAFSKKFMASWSSTIASIEYRRVILDSGCFKYLVRDKTIVSLVNSLTTEFKWLQLQYIPRMGDDIVPMLKFIIGSDWINYPLYNEMSATETNSSPSNHPSLLGAAYIEGIILELEKIYSHQDKAPTIVRKGVRVNMTENEQLVYKFLRFTETYDVVERIINNFSINITFLSPSLPSCKPEEPEDPDHTESNVDTDTCSICMREHDINLPLIVTECNHIFCTECALNSTKFNKSCPLCRSPLDVNRFNQVCTNKNDVGSKLKQLLTVIVSINNTSGLLTGQSKGTNTRIIIYVDQTESMTYVTTMLSKKLYNFTIVELVGSIAKKSQMIREFNSTSTGSSCSNNRILIMKIDDHELSKTVCGIKDIIFYDFQKDDGPSYYGNNFLNNKIDKLNIYFMVYYQN